MRKNLVTTAVISIVLLSAAAAFGQVDIPRRTTAITYPRDEIVLVNFRGTTRFPRMKGEARMKRTSRNGTEIELSVSKMPRPFELGAGYATYVVWAIGPDGTADNLGEIKRRGFFEFDSKISVTTPLQTFALIITAEPHFMVKRPSAQVMLENLNPTTLSGKAVPTTSSAQYFGNSSDYFRDSRTPEIAEIDYSKTPSTILQARQAIALARFAGAERDASAELAEAESLLQNADAGYRAGRREEDVDITARKAISIAVKAEETSIVRKEAREKRNEQARNDAEIRDSERKYQRALSDIEDLKAELAREIRNRELSERDVLNQSNNVRDLKDENARLRDELTRAKFDLDNAKARIASLENEKNSVQEAREKEASAAQIKINEPQFIQSLKTFGTVARTERGIVLTLPENLWTNSRSTTFVPQADGKLTSLGDILGQNSAYDVAIEVHTDNTGNADTIQAVTDGRAELVKDKLASLGVADSRLSARGFGASLPVSPNTTAAGKAKNRRVQLILSLRQ